MIAADKEMEKRDKDMKVIEVESETDEQSPSDEGYETPPEEPVAEAEPSEQEAVAEAVISVVMDCLLQEVEREGEPEAMKRQRNAFRHWMSSSGGSRIGRVWSRRTMVRRACLRNLWMIPPPILTYSKSKWRGSRSSRTTDGTRAQSAKNEGEGPPAEEEVRKCLDATFSFPHDVYSFLQDTSYERAKDVQEFQDAVLSPVRRGGFGTDGQDAAELAIADKLRKATLPKNEGVNEEALKPALCGIEARWSTSGTID